MTVVPLLPRLVDVKGAAAYLGVSPWTIRDLVDAGRIQRVRLPGMGTGDLRRVLLEVRDLDRLVDSAKDGPTDLGEEE